MQESVAHESVAQSGIDEGTRLGRYLVLQTIGRGATGVVLAAWDDELDRKVAIKLLPRRSGNERARLQHEARALARLTHPNVIRIHDVGEHEQRVFMVMEFVEGRTLVGWRAPLSELLRVWLAAGRGLAAAHAAGLVHGDFKPANVLLGVDQQPRVSDFGHARLDGSAPVGMPTVPTRLDDAISITHSDAFIGTPTTMAPELFEGAVADARSDQFAFCASLYEALWSQRPFAGDDVLTLASEVTAGRLRSPPALPVVPLRIRGALLRGLSRAPGDRFPSMSALLEVLATDAWRWPRRLAPALAVATVAWGGVTWLAAAPAPARSYCESVDARLDSLWHDDRARSLGSTFATLQPQWGADAFTQVRADLDAYVEQLRARQRGACERHGAPTNHRHVRELLCLQRAEHQLGALIDLLEHADAEVIEHAGDATAALDDVARCGEDGPQIDDAVAAQTHAVAERIARARVAAAAFRDDTALAEAASAATEAEALQQPWYVAEARMIEGKIVDRNGDIAASERSFHAAFSAALASNRHDLAVSAAIGVAGATAARGDHDNALRWLDHAEAERTRTADADGELARSIASTRGQLAFHHDDLELARALFTEVLALERAQGDNDGDDDGLPATLLNIGLAEANLGHADAALGWLERSLAGEVRRHGERHPALFRPLNAICHVQTDRGETTAAIAACQRAIDLVRSARPGADPRLSPLYTNLGTAWFEAGDTAAAERAHLAALDNAMRMQPDDVLLLASIENNLGVLYGHLERFEPAAQQYGAAHARLLRAFGPDHPSTALVATNLAMVWVKQGRFDDAEALLRDGLERMRARLGDEHPDLALSFAELGRIQRERGDAAGAVALFERAWALRAATGGDDLELADTSWGLAWSLADSGGDRGRVDALVEQAEALYRRHGGAWNDKADEMLAWHVKLPRPAGR